MYPTTRQNGLIAVALDDELLVYDLERHRAHCLNRAAALVWRHCDGETSVDELAGLLRRELNADLGQEYVWYALRRLSGSGLLASSPGIPPQQMWTRRDLLRRLAAAGVATVALPTVISIVAPTTLQAQASCLAAGSLCDPPNTIACCPGLRCRGLPPGSPGTCRA